MNVVIALSAMMISCLLAACPTRYCRVRPSNADTCCSVSHAAPLRRITVLLSLRKGSKIPRKNKYHDGYRKNTTVVDRVNVNSPRHKR